MPLHGTLKNGEDGKFYVYFTTPPLKVQTLTLARQTRTKVSLRGGMDGLWTENGKKETEELLCHAPFLLLFSPSFSSI